MAPMIHNYEADAPVGGPVDSRQARSADTGNIGGALSELGNSAIRVGDVIHQRQVQEETADSQSKLSKLFADQSVALDQLVQNPGPDYKSMSDRFMQGFDDKLAKLSDGVETSEAQRHLQVAGSNMRSHFLRESFKSQMLYAGQKAVDGVSSQVTNFSATLINDPSSFETVLQLTRDNMKALVESGTLPAHKADEINQRAQVEYAKSAVKGWINLDPNLAKDMINKGRWDQYVDGDVKQQLIGEANQGINAIRVEDQRQKTAAREALKDQQNVVMDGFLPKVFNNQLSAKEVLANTVLSPEQKEHFVRMIETNAKERIKTDPHVFISMWDRVHRPDGDPQKINDEDVLNQYMGRGLTVENIQTLRNEMASRKTEQGRIEADLKQNFLNKVIQPKLTKTNPMMGFKDPEGDDRYQSFLSWFSTEYAAQRKAGKQPVALLTPGSPDYLGKNLSSFTATPNEVFQAITRQAKGTTEGGYVDRLQSGLSAPAKPGSATTPSAAAPVAPEKPAPPRTTVEPRRAGESAADYLKRTGKH